MEGAFAWLGQIIESFGRLIPRIVIVRATHAGVKWVRGKRIREMHPGLHVYWPVTTEYELRVVARQTVNLPTQVLMTSDQKSVVLGSIVVYRIGNVIRAFGERNWDVDTTVSDITQEAIVEVVTNTALDELLKDVGAVTKRLTLACRKKLNMFGVKVYRCGITDFSTCKVHKIVGDFSPKMEQ